MLIETFLESKPSHQPNQVYKAAVNYADSSQAIQSYHNNCKQGLLRKQEQVSSADYIGFFLKEGWTGTYVNIKSILL